jgi:DnaJ family protein C protein 13
VGLFFFLRSNNVPRAHTLYYLEQQQSVTRHDRNRPVMESASSSSSSSISTPPLQEEPEYLARYLVVKHSWRGRYKRILCISNVSIITLDPNTLSVTNSYDAGADFESASAIIGRDENSSEFNLSVRTDGKGKFKAIKFSSKFRASILTELHRIRWNRLAPVAEFPVLHLRRKPKDWVLFVSHSFLSVNFD